MSETSTYLREETAAREVSTTQLLGQVLFLVAIALGFCALGTLIGRDLSLATARVCSFAGFGMLLVSSFAGERFRVGPFAMGWLFATALLIGLGLGPVIAYFASVDADALTQAFAGTAATVLGAAALGFEPRTPPRPHGPLAWETAVRSGGCVGLTTRSASAGTTRGVRLVRIEPPVTFPIVLLRAPDLSPVAAAFAALDRAS
ncbi:MAG TPA: hypothetical protein VHJ39_09190 [Solirubrobacteraceae bacterium]|jgi:hypothetical protein|nr:hypothetical protein [Solirubrobacteraceae bacterium]